MQEPNISLHSSYPALMKFAEAGGALLVVGHGTRLPSGQAQLRELVEWMKSACPSIAMQACFLELAEPDIASGLEQLKKQSRTQVIVVPILLFAAAHAREDIPEAVQPAAERFQVDVVGQSPPLNHHWATLALSHLRCLQAILCKNPLGCNYAAFCDVAQTCITPGRLSQAEALLGSLQQQFQSGHDGSLSKQPFQVELEEQLRRTTLVMIGRGSSEQPARDSMHEFCRKRCEIAPVANAIVGFFAGDEVTVEKALEAAAEQNISDDVLVQPHLLFEGQLTQQLRSAIDQMRLKYPRKRWNCAMPLGGDKALAKTYLSLAEGVAQGLTK